MSLKQNLTKSILNELTGLNQIPLDQALSTWWYNLTNHGGLRLTESGLHVLKDILGFESWTLKLPRFNAKLLLALDRKLTYPYYLDIKKGELTLFGGKEATLATLHGDLDRWLQLTENRKS